MSNPGDRPSWDEYFLSIAEVVARRSHDLETKVGCVITGQDYRISACGYNGFPPHFPDSVLPKKRPDKYVYMVHAEVNAIVSSGRDLRGGTLYCTITPCVECAKIIITAGIKKVVCAKPYTGATYDLEFVKSLFSMGGVSFIIGDKAVNFQQ